MVGKKIKRENETPQTDQSQHQSQVTFSEVKLLPEKAIEIAWIATVTPQTSEIIPYSTKHRIDTLTSLVNRVENLVSAEGIIVLPAGWFNTNKHPPSDEMTSIERELRNILSEASMVKVLCLGIDGSLDEEGYIRDQISLAIDQDGIIAMGRKFYPSAQEREHVNLTENYLNGEAGHSRVFSAGGIKWYLGVCYDVFGVRHLDLQNPGVGGFISLVHCFYPKGKGPAGDPYFARHGFAGASKQWGCPVVGTATFFDRDVPERWPTAVFWNRGNISTQQWRYDDNILKPEQQVEISTPEGKALVKFYSIAGMKGLGRD